MDLAAVPVAIAQARRMRWVWPWTWFVLAPVTSALLIAAIFVARRPAAIATLEQQTPLVALQTPSQPPAYAAVPQAAPLDTTAPATPRAKESAPPKPATPPSRERTPAFASPMLPAPDTTVAVQAERAEHTVSRAPVADKVDGARAENLPRGGGNNSAVGSRSQTVTVDSSAQTPTEAPPLIADGAASGGVSTSASPAPATPARLAKQQPAATLSDRNGFAASETVSEESALDRDVNTIVRSPDPQILWRISRGRFVERSSDAGQTWRAQWTSVNAHVVAGSAPSVETCWLVGRGGIVLLTTDGKKWRTIEPPASTDFAGVDSVGRLVRHRHIDRRPQVRNQRRRQALDACAVNLRFSVSPARNLPARNPSCFVQSLARTLMRRRGLMPSRSTRFAISAALAAILILLPLAGKLKECHAAAAAKRPKRRGHSGCDHTKGSDRSFRHGLQLKSRAGARRAPDPSRSRAFSRCDLKTWPRPSCPRPCISAR